MNTLKLAVCLLAMVMFFAFSYSVVPALEKAGADAEDLFKNKCNLCHSSDRAKSKSRTEESWRRTVLRMKNKNNAPITDEEAEIIIRHLADKYGR
jgi:hypothetical protein